MHAGEPRDRGPARLSAILFRQHLEDGVGFVTRSHFDVRPRVSPAASNIRIH